MVGQEFVAFLENHPWFDLTFLAASDRSAGKPYREATTWRLGGETPSYVRNIVVSDSVPKAELLEAVEIYQAMVRRLSK